MPSLLPEMVGLTLGVWARKASILYDLTVKYRAEFAALTWKSAAIDVCCWACNPWLTPSEIAQACSRFSAVALLDARTIKASARPGASRRIPRFHRTIGLASSWTTID